MNVEEKVLNSIQVICDAGNTNVTDNTKINVKFPVYEIEEKELKDTIIYLKENAKLNKMCQIINESDVLQLDFSKKISYLEDCIKNKQEEIKNLPKVTIVRPRTGLTGEFKDLEKIICRRKNDSLRAKRAQKVAELKEELKALKEKLKAINDFKKLISNKEHEAQKFFNTENKINDVKKDALISYVKNVLRSDVYENRFLEELGVFETDDEGHISINNKNARRLISLSKNEKSIIRLYDFLKSKDDYKFARQAYRNNKHEIEDYDSFIEAADSNEMKLLNIKVNELSKAYDELHEMENKAREGTFISRAINFFRRKMGLETKIKVPKKVLEKRQEVADQIYAFVGNIGKDENMLSMYKQYVKARKTIDEDSKLDIEELGNIARSISEFGDLIEFIGPEIKLESIKENVKDTVESLKANLEKDKATIEEARNKVSELNSKLTKRDVVILEKVGQSGIDYIANKFYKNRVKPIGIIKYDNKVESLQNATAITVLEALVGSKRVDYEKISEVYTQIFGEEGLEKEKTDMQEKVQSIISSIKEQTDKVCGLGQEQVISIFAPKMAEIPSKEEKIEEVEI